MAGTRRADIDREMAKQQKIIDDLAAQRKNKGRGRPSTTHASKVKAAESKIANLQRNILPTESAPYVPRTAIELIGSAAQHPQHHAAASSVPVGRPSSVPVGQTRSGSASMARTTATTTASSPTTTTARRAPSSSSSTGWRPRSRPSTQRRRRAGLHEARAAALGDPRHRRQPDRERLQERDDRPRAGAYLRAADAYGLADDAVPEARLGFGRRRPRAPVGHVRRTARLSCA